MFLVKIIWFCGMNRIMDQLDEWTLMIAWEWPVYGIQCTRSLNSYRRLLVVRASNSLKLILLISIVSNHLPVILFDLLFISVYLLVFVWDLVLFMKIYGRNQGIEFWLTLNVHSPVLYSSPLLQRNQLSVRREIKILTSLPCFLLEKCSLGDSNQVLGF